MNRPGSALNELAIYPQFYFVRGKARPALRGAVSAPALMVSPARFELTIGSWWNSRPCLRQP